MRLGLVMLVFLLSSCDMSEKRLTKEVFERQQECLNYWRETLEEWKSAGGGLDKSIIETREQIRKDETTYFANLVREVWEHQKESEEPFSDRVFQIGAWPVPQETRRRVSLALFEVQSRLSGKCETGVELPALLWKEVYKGGTVKILEEMPDALPRRSPDVPRWLMFWLLYSPTTSEVAG